MAVISNPFNVQEEDKNKDPNQTVQLSSGPTAASGGAPAGQPQQDPNTRQRQGSGRFVNLQRYIDANQGAGSQIASRISGTADRVQKATEPEVTNRLSNIRETVQSEQNRLGQAGQLAQTVQTGGVSDIERLAQERADDFAKFRTGQNLAGDIQTGSQDLTGLVGQTQEELSGIAQDVRTEGGRFNLLRRAVGGPSYTSGQRRLDNLLLQATGRDSLGNLQTGLQSKAEQELARQQQFQGEFDTSLQNIGDLTTQAQQQITGALGGFGADGGGRLGQLYTDLSTRQQDAIKRQEEEVARIRGELQANAGMATEGPQGAINLSDQTFDLLGLGDTASIYNLDLGQFADKVRAGDEKITLADVADQETREADKLAALRVLAGLDTDESIDQTFGKREGTAGASFDSNEFQSALRQAEQDFLNKAQNTVLTGVGENRHAYHDAFGQKKYRRSKATEQARVSDLLENTGIVKGGVVSSDPAGRDLATLTGGAALGVPGAVLGNLLGGDAGDYVLDRLGLNRGSDRAAGKAKKGAQKKAATDLVRQYEQFLRDSGYGRTIRRADNNLTTGGMFNVK